MKSSQPLAKKTETTTAIALSVKPFEQLSPARISRDLSRITNMSAAIDVADKVPTMALVSKIYGRENAENLIKCFLFDLEDFFDFDKKISSTQLNFIASEILAKYYALTLADIHVVFRSAKGGEYGEFYGRIAPDRVLHWFDAYQRERCEACAELSYASHRGDIGGNFTGKMAAEQLAKLEKKFGFREHLR